MKFYTGIYNSKLQKALFTVSRCIVMNTKFFFDIEPDGELSFITDDVVYRSSVFDDDIRQLTLKSIAQVFENYLDKFKTEEDKFFWNDYIGILGKASNELDKSTQHILSNSYHEGSIPYKWLFIAVDVMKGLTAKELVQKYTKKNVDEAVGSPLNPFMQEARKNLFNKLNEIDEEYSTLKSVAQTKYLETLAYIEKKHSSEIEELMKKPLYMLY